MQPSRGAVSFRIIASQDRDFLYRVYAGTRDWEFRLTTWDDAEKHAFLRRQFDAQDLHYQAAFPAAVHRIIQLDGVDIGRLIVERQDDCLRIIDLSLLADFRNRGIGTDILRSLLNEAHGGKVPVRLHVQRDNPALGLYLRHGFRQTGVNGHHLALEWQPDLRPREI